MKELVAEKSKTQKKYNLSQLQAKLIKEEDTDYPADSLTETVSKLEKDRETVRGIIGDCWNPNGGNSDAVGWIMKALEELGM
jgi:hypothetical protein